MSTRIAIVDQLHQAGSEVGAHAPATLAIERILMGMREEHVTLKGDEERQNCPLRRGEYAGNPSGRQGQTLRARRPHGRDAPALTTCHPTPIYLYQRAAFSKTRSPTTTPHHDQPQGAVAQAKATGGR